MKLTIDTSANTITAEGKSYNLYSKEGFELISRHWVRVGWNMKYQYTFSWMGRPIIQLPEDMIRTQEVIYRIRPDLIIETGIAHGGSLIYYASLCKAFGKGRVVGVDIEIRPHNRAAIEAHEMFDLITMIEGSSTDPAIVDKVKTEVKPGDTVLVILDSNHTYDHVMGELEAYADLVSVGSYIVATDGIMFDLEDVPRGGDGWTTDNPKNAAEDFVKDHPNFIIEQPAWPFNESALEHNITHWPGAWIKRVS
ncbi:MAG: cephalosporin hydroxylase family protein [Alphaproteobacteria bacterium]|nr:cephalosporin hydroxylase family protein [Alphaproteobacteria bacterium]MCD8566639.1 cephalosporin hydroxylase family protein [Alphaproteobacteria bacterium]